MRNGVKRKLSNTEHAVGTGNLPTASTRLKAVGLNERLLSGVLTPQSSELNCLPQVIGRTRLSGIEILYLKLFIVYVLGHDSQLSGNDFGGTSERR